MTFVSSTSYSTDKIGKMNKKEKFHIHNNGIVVKLLAKQIKSFWSSTAQADFTVKS